MQGITAGANKPRAVALTSCENTPGYNLAKRDGQVGIIVSEADRRAVTAPDRWAKEMESAIVRRRVRATFGEEAFVR